MTLSKAVSLYSVISQCSCPKTTRASSVEDACPCAKPFAMASRVVMFNTFSPSTICSAMTGSLPVSSAVDLMSERMYDWYFSGMGSPVGPTTVAEPMVDPGAMMMLSQAMEIRAPAEAA